MMKDYRVVELDNPVMCQIEPSIHTFVGYVFGHSTNRNVKPDYWLTIFSEKVRRLGSNE